MTGQQVVVLQLAVLIVALCGIVYELLIATVSSYLLGDSVRQFSITIGLFMAAMGLGAYVTKHFSRRLVSLFVIIEILIALVGGLSTIILFFVFPHTIFYQPTMYGLIVAIGSLVGMEIPILTRVLSRNDGIRKSIANVLSLDYFGALIGSVAFPLFLLPFFGLFRASFFIAFINVVIACVTIGVFADRLRQRHWLMTFTGLIGVGLVISFFYAETISSYAEGNLYTDKVIYEKQTRYQKIVVTRDNNTGLHRLFIDGHIQFAEADEYRYHESLVHPVMATGPVKKRVLVLGGGDGMALREILKYTEVERVDLVDIDGEMTRLCSTFPPITSINEGALTASSVQIHNADAWRYVRDSILQWDRIIIDLPDPHNESLNKMYSLEFYKLLLPRLAEGGLLVTQSTSPLVTTNTFWSIRTTMEAAGLSTYSYQTSLPSFGGSWGFTIGKASGKAPATYIIPPEKTKYLTTEVMAKAGTFAKDEHSSQVIVNSIFKPQLYLTYNKDVSLW